MSMSPVSSREHVTPHVASLVTYLYDTCRDGVRGYRHAVRDVRDPGTREALTRLYGQREECVVVLRDVLFGLGVLAREEGTPAGAVHAAWMDAMATLTGGDTRGVLKACARGEKAALHVYDVVLRESLPDDIEEIVRQQYATIQHAQAELARLLAAA